jgi:HEAT repeat protein
MLLLAIWLALRAAIWYRKRLSKGDGSEAKSLLPRMSIVFISAAGLLALIAWALAPEARRGAAVPLLENTDPRLRIAAGYTLAGDKDPRVVKSLTSVLRGDDIKLRLMSVKVLAMTGIPSAGPALVEALSDKAPEVRAEAARAICGMDRPEVEGLKGVVDLLIDGDKEVRAAAAQALEGRPVGVSARLEALRQELQWKELPLGEEAVDLLAGELRGKDSSARIRAARFLGSISSPRALESLLIGLEVEERGLKRVITHALISRPDPRAAKPLLKAIGHHDSQVRENTAKALAAINDPSTFEPLLILVQKENRLGSVVFPALENIDLPGEEFDLGPLESLLLDSRETGNAAVVLARLGPRAVGVLEKGSRDSDSRVRLPSLRALGVIGDPRAIPTLLEALLERHSTVSDEGAEALAGIGSPAVKALLRVLGGRDERARAKAMGALARFDEPGALPILMKGLSDESGRVRANAIEGLGRWKRPEVVDALLKILSDDEERDSPRKKAAESLGLIGDPKAVPSLLNAAVTAQGYLPGASLTALVKMSEAAAPAVLEVLRRGDPRSKKVAIRFIERAKLVRARGNLVGLLGEADVRRDVIRALNALGWAPASPREKVLVLAENSRWKDIVSMGEAAVEPLIGLLEDKDVTARRGAAESLGRLGSKKAIDPLAARLLDADPRTRREAGDALKAIGWKPGTVEEAIPYYIATRRMDDLVNLGAQAIPGLAKGLAHRDGNFRRLCVHAMGAIGGPSAFPHLETALSDEWSSVRKESAEALKKAGWKPTDDHDRTLYYLARGANEKVVEIGAPAVDLLLEILLKSKDAEYRAQAATVLGGIGDARAVPALIEGIESRWYVVIEASAKALGRVGDPEGMKALVKLLRRDDFNRKIPGYARAAILDAGTAAIPHLVEGFHDPEDLHRIVDLLKIHGDPALAQLISALDSKDVVFRERVADALEKITGEEFLGEDQEAWRKWLAARKR